MMTQFSQAAALVGLATLLGGRAVSRPVVPDAIQAPSAEAIVLLAHASGVQIYACRRSADGLASWALETPDAQLRNEAGAVIGRHYAGPTWKHNDGSEVSGKMAARVDSPDANSIPWLLVTATGHSESGILTRSHQYPAHPYQGWKPSRGV